MDTYLLIGVGVDGDIRIRQTTLSEVPENFVMPGEIAFVIKPLDIKARHMHEVQTRMTEAKPNA